jgi:hypothetical protein
MSAVVLYKPATDLAAQTAEAVASVRAILAAVPMSPVFANTLAAWAEIGDRDPGAAASITALEAAMRVLMKVAAERSGFSARPRRGTVSRVVDLVVTDRGGSASVMMALGAVAGLALVAHGDAGRAAIRRIGDERHELMRAIGETIVRSRA